MSVIHRSFRNPDFDEAAELEEAFAELELAMEDQGWVRAGGYSNVNREFSPSGRRTLREYARFSYIQNPLINHGVSVQSHYVFGQGVSVTADDDDINDLVQRFLDDRRNRYVFSSTLALAEKERELMVEGDLFFVLFTDPSNGRVTVRQIYPDEITDIITNPEDSQDPWFYRREWSTTDINGQTRDHKRFYADWRLLYLTKDQRPDPPTARSNLVAPVDPGNDTQIWFEPIYHVKVGGFSDMKFGISEVNCSLAWAKAVKNDLEDYATVKRALAKFAAKITRTGGGSKTVENMKQRLAHGLGLQSPVDKNPPPEAGSLFVRSGQSVDYDVIRTAGAQPTPEEGRRLYLMAGAGMGIPETILMGNADVGNLATAKTLDRPTELQMRTRQELWKSVLSDICHYVIFAAVQAPKGKLKGSIVIDDYTGELSVELNARDDNGKPMHPEVTIGFPPILDREPLPLVQAIVQAATLGGQSSAGVFDDRTLVRTLADALNIPNVDDLLDELFPSDAGNTVDAGHPTPPPGIPPENVPEPTPNVIPVPIPPPPGANPPTNSPTRRIAPPVPPRAANSQNTLDQAANLVVAAAMRDLMTTIKPIMSMRERRVSGE